MMDHVEFLKRLGARQLIIGNSHKVYLLKTEDGHQLYDNNGYRTSIGFLAMHPSAKLNSDGSIDLFGEKIETKE